MSDVHNSLGCIACHGGTGEADFEGTHEGLITSPALGSEASCYQCHSDAVSLEMTQNSLHANLTGYYTVLADRGGDFSNPNLQQSFDNHCIECHTNCGSCHVSRPQYTGGGLIREHEFRKTAPITVTCLSCHGGRVGSEYQGKNEGVPADVHWAKAGMPCTACHTVVQFHGSEEGKAHRFDGPPTPHCLDCHPETAPGSSGILQHDLHGDKVDCYVCHSAGPYKNCYGCHVGLDSQGLPYRKTDLTELDFKIGRNPLQSEERPWEYVLLRHAPASPTIFDLYGPDLLPEFDNVPTWKYAPIHNIQRNTPQNASCDACHGNDELFLTEADVLPELRSANRSVIVPGAPPMPGSN